MSRSALVGNVTAMLADAGFVVSDRCAIRPKSFDVAARRGRDVLLVKILGNIDAFDGATGAEMRRLGEYLGATPMVIGLRTRDEELKPGVTYFRHGVPVLSPDTAMDLFVEEVPPLIYAAPADCTSTSTARSSKTSATRRVMRVGGVLPREWTARDAGFWGVWE